jgi:hypothetical protein
MGQTKDFTKCSTCQDSPPAGYIAGYYYSNCMACVNARTANREAKRKARLKAKYAAIAAVGGSK